MSSGIVDGLALRAAPPAIPDVAFTAAMTELDGSFDALADALTAEAVFQLVRGNPAGALVDLDDIVRGERPPQLEVTESPQLGTRMTYRVAAVVPAGQRAPGWPAVHTPRADADPLLDAWCGHLLGPAAATVVTIQGTANGQPATVPVGPRPPRHRRRRRRRGHRRRRRRADRPVPRGGPRADILLWPAPPCASIRSGKTCCASVLGWPA